MEPLPDTCIADVSATPEAIYSLRESVSLAFMIALHSLPPQQRAALILRDVLDWHATEVAELLDRSVPAVNSALQRARATLAQTYHPIALEDIKAPSLSPSLQSLLDCYVRAWEANDVDALVSLLKEDATFSMPPQPVWYVRRAAIGQFFQTSVFTEKGAGQWRLLPTFANAQPAFALYRLGSSSGAFSYFGLMVLTIEGDAIASVVAFVDVTLGARFGLAFELPSTASGSARE
jgi:RNA polymerase sigma-70 factor (ECF subfamily)